MVELNRELIIKKSGNKPNLDTIILSRNNINKIDANVFKDFTDLQYLLLDNNELEQLEGTLFESLSKLKLLCFRENRLKQIESNTFKGLTQLKSLNLSGNQLTTINANSFINLSNLNDLCLSKNKLKRIESNTFNGLVNLKILELSYNEIEEINEGSFNGLSNLKELHLNHNKLKRIDANAFKNLNKLQTLLLDHNQLEEINRRLFNGLSNLKVLHLESNKLDRIERGCFDHLKSIKLIQLDCTEFKVFSFLNQQDNEYYNLYKNKLYFLGFLTDWNSFLDQFKIPFKDFINLRLLIVDYYDSLISEIDIYSEELLKEEVETTKVNEYRSKAIEEINKAKYENLERYESNKEKYKYDRNELTDEKLESIRSELFEEKFCFLLRIGNKNNEFNLVTIVSDFYWNQFDRNLLKSLIQSYLQFVYKELLVLSFVCDLIIWDSSKCNNKVISISKETLRKIKHIQMNDDFCGSDFQYINLSRIKSLYGTYFGYYLTQQKNFSTVLKNLEYILIIEEDSRFIEFLKNVLKNE